MKNTAATATKKWDTVIELSGVTKYFDQKRPVGLLKREKHRVHALSDVSFTLQKGEFAAYAGPNGAGKSTTFKLLSGMLRPQEGSVRLFGMDPSQHRIPVMRRTGVLFGNRSELWWDHPVRASFEWKKAVWDIDDATYLRICDEMRELLGIGDFWNSFARELSLGQRMRANLALTLLHDPELVLLDEPTLGLDVLAKRQMIDFLKKINREKQVTLLVTSHDMDDLTEMANRILLINSGRLAFDGDYQQLIQMAGDNRIIKLRLRGDAPALAGASYLGEEDGKHLYRYDASTTSAQQIFGAISGVEHVQDVELVHEAIEQVIARLYQAWRKEA
ncbi:MAG: ATP-binding cassette domain-containing protein [Clostridiales bacterium]|nr:ATP-binding cassette domain-containing protein [Clostridiales bacterium]